PPCIWAQQQLVLDALSREIRSEFALDERLVDKLRRQSLEDIQFAVEESQPLRLAFLDNANFDSTNQRSPFTLERRSNRLRLWRNRTGGRVLPFAESGIGDQHDLRASLVLAKRECASADRMRAKIGTVGLDYLAGHRRGIGHRERIGKAQVGL